MTGDILSFFADPAPALEVQFRPPNDATRRIRVSHRLAGPADSRGLAYLDSLGQDPSKAALRSFYAQHDGAQLCVAPDARTGQATALLELKPALELQSFTRRYLPGGDLAWAIDRNKSAALYRSAAAWIALASIAGGPDCLTFFTSGALAGSVCYVTPQSAFNLLKPVARGFEELLERIARDLPAFLRLVRARVKIRGEDGAVYGFVPVGYLKDANKLI
jgi:hypothetical protein